MTNQRKTLFISDLHLEESRPDMTEQFLTLLKAADASVDGLYILGDLFEVWIGDDDNTPFHHAIVAALKAATEKGLPIYFMHGNRDFLIGKKFLRDTGIKLLSDEEKISLYGTPALLMHGDTLCTRDVLYLNARKKGRNKFLQFIFLLLPLRQRRKIADKMRAKSTKHTSTTAVEIMDVTHDEVIRVMQKHDVAFLIHGHTHRPGINPFFINGSPVARIVLDAWHDRGNVLVWDDTGAKNLMDIETLMKIMHPE